MGIYLLTSLSICDVQKIAVELIVESGGSSKSIVLQKACSDIPMNTANINCLKLGLEDYVFKHGNRLVDPCHSCFSTGCVLIIFNFYTIIRIGWFLISPYLLQYHISSG